MEPEGRDCALLVVGPDEGFVRALQILLESERPYPVEVAHSGPEALRMLGHIPSIRVAVCDLGATSADGVDLLAQLRRYHPRVVVISTIDPRPRRHSGGAARPEVRHHLSKPIDPEDLLARVDDAIDSRQEPARARATRNPHGRVRLASVADE